MAKRSREDYDPLPVASSEFVSEHTSPDIKLQPEERIKLVHVENLSGKTPEREVMRCSLPPHRQTVSFTSYEEYEVHYKKVHLNRCNDCRKNFPTQHFLDLHLQENHDPLVEILRDQGERTYACFVEDCDRKCSTPQKRRMHLIDKHMFPKDYDFNIVDDGVDQRSSMLRTGRHRRRSSAAQHKSDIENRARRRTSTLELARESNDLEGSKGEVDKNSADGGDIYGKFETPQSDTEMDDLTGALSALKFVPTSVRFGRGKGRGRGGFSKS